MAKGGVSPDTLDRIENYIAEILNGREALIDVEVALIAQARRGHLTPERLQNLLDKIEEARIAVKRGHDFGRKARGNPEIY